MAVIPTDVSTLSTAEAELNAATLAWQIIEGVRLLINDLGFEVPSVKLLLDNKAALTIAECGASWRTRYFSVRAHRLHEEHLVGRAVLEYCRTDVMLADALTKLAGAPVILTLHHCMNGGDVIQDSHVSSAVAEVCNCESGEQVVLAKPRRKKRKSWFSKILGVTAMVSFNPVTVVESIRMSVVSPAMSPFQYWPVVKSDQNAVVSPGTDPFHAWLGVRVAVTSSMFQCNSLTQACCFSASRTCFSFPASVMAFTSQAENP